MDNSSGAISGRGLSRNRGRADSGEYLSLDKDGGSSYPERVKPRAILFALAFPALAAASPPANGAIDGRRRDGLIAAGVIVSLAMFLWDRRRKG